jgi:hypothetical protein
MFGKNKKLLTKILDVLNTPNFKMLVVLSTGISPDKVDKVMSLDFDKLLSDDPDKFLSGVVDNVISFLMDNAYSSNTNFKIKELLVRYYNGENSNELTKNIESLLNNKRREIYVNNLNRIKLLIEKQIVNLSKEDHNPMLN